jgi:hypothetical protein
MKAELPFVIHTEADWQSGIEHCAYFYKKGDNYYIDMHSFNKSLNGTIRYKHRNQETTLDMVNQYYMKAKKQMKPLDWDFGFATTETMIDIIKSILTHGGQFEES